jgi:hypothetical protein
MHRRIFTEVCKTLLVMQRHGALRHSRVDGNPCDPMSSREILFNINHVLGLLIGAINLNNTLFF